jgi:hypothetical protein
MPTGMTKSLADGGGTATIPRGRRQERPRAVLMAERSHDLSTCLSMSPEGLSNDGAMSPHLMPPALRWLKFNQPGAATGKHRLASPSRAPRRALRPARRGTNNAIRRPQPMTMVASMSKQATPAWNMPQQS